MSRQPLQSINSNVATGRMSLGPAARQQVKLPISAAASRQSLGPGVQQPRQRNSSLSSARTSLQSAQAPRPSMAASVRRSTTTRADPRPIEQKQYMKNSVELLIQYLASHGYDQPISPKILSQPNNKEYFSIMNFLMLQYDPNFKWSSKKNPEDIVVEILKTLKYPFSINKSYLKSVGSLHCWPSLLATLTWFVELLMYEEEVSTQEDSCFGSSMVGEVVFFQHLEKGYQAFLSGDDNALKLESELGKHFAVKNDQIANEVNCLEVQKQTVQRIISELVKDGEELPLLERKKADLISDVNKFQSWVKKLQEHQTALEKIRSEHHEELKEKETDLQVLETELRAAKTQLESQELDAAEVDRMNRERASLDATLQTTTSQKERIESQKWEIELRITRLIEALNKHIISFNQYANSLKLVPLTAKNAKGINYEMQFNIHGQTARDVIGLDLRGSVKPALLRLKESFTTSINSSEEQHFVLQDELNKIEEVANEKRDKTAEVESQLKQIEEIYEFKKNKGADLISQMEKEAEAIQSECTRLKLLGEGDLEKSQREFELISKKYNELEKLCEDEKEGLSTLIINTLNLLMKHKHYIQETLGTVQKHLENSAQEIEGLELDGSIE